jgi:ATP-dependent Clp protease ATP-binding subunit ClpC
MTDLPHTTRAKQALSLAQEAAVARSDEFVGTEHLLLGLLAERTGPAAQVLAHLGVTRERVEQLLAQARPHA